MSDSSVPANRAGRKPGAKNRYSAATISRDIKEAIHAALYLDGGPTKYFRDLKKRRPDLFVMLVGKALMKDDDSSVGGLVINVVQLNSPAVPTPGVLASNMPEHIAPQRHLRLVDAEVVDVTEVVAK